MFNTVRTQFEEHDRRIFWALLMLGGCAVLLYVYFIGVAVVSVVARKEAESELGRMTAAVATLESAYAALDRTIDLTLAHKEGFVDVSAPRFVSTESRTDVLTLREGGVME